jgi:excisionase family DNA binding protein
MINDTVTVKDILTFEEACQYTNTSRSWMYKMTHTRTIPHSKPNGKKLYFRRSDLDNWMMSGYCKSAKENDIQAATHVSTRPRVH